MIKVKLITAEKQMDFEKEVQDYLNKHQVRYEEGKIKILYSCAETYDYSKYTALDIDNQSYEEEEEELINE